MKTTVVVISIAALSLAVPAAQSRHQNLVLDLWAQGKPAFGVYAPNENAPQRGPGGTGRGEAARGEAPRGQGGQRGPARRALYTRDGAEKLAMNPLYDYVFLNLEGSYDAGAVEAYAAGLRSSSAASRKTLIVRIPSVESDGPDVTKARIQEVFDAGADGVTVPHVRGLDEATQVLGFFRDAKADVWSPSNPKGEKIAMLMLEDPNAVAQAKQIADLKGLSILACGIGSLTQALGGDRAGAEAATQSILAETKRVRIANMLTAGTQDVEKRVNEGFLALLMQGSSADEAIGIGRAASGRK